MNNAQVDKLRLQGDFIISTWVVNKRLFSSEIRGFSESLIDLTYTKGQLWRISERISERSELRFFIANFKFISSKIPFFGKK